jgi:Txe/YoeB family toxin of toxin-antitoxin system
MVLSLLCALALVEAIMRDPLSGMGKPEPLKYLSSGAWSRRLTQEHRIVYLVRDERIDFLQARYITNKLKIYNISFISLRTHKNAPAVFFGRVHFWVVNHFGNLTGECP